MINFTPTQKKMVAAGLTVLSLAVVLVFTLCIGWAVLKFLDIASPALTPVIMGVFLALFFKPYYGYLLARVRNPTLALVLMLSSVVLPLVLVCWFGGTFVLDQVVNLVKSAPTIVSRFSAWVNVQLPQAQGFFASLGVPAEQMKFFTDPAAFSHELIAQIAGAYGVSAVKAGVGALKYLSTIGTFLLSLLFFVFFLMRPDVRGADCVRHLPFLKEETRAFVAEQIDSFIGILVSFFQRQVLICLVEGLLYGLGFLLVGLPYGFVLGFLLGALNLVPLFGTIVILPLALPIAFFGDGGSLLRLIGVSGVWVTGQLLDGYLITPTIQGDKTGLGFAGVIFSFLFWGVIFHSLLGLLLAIPLSAFCTVLWRAIKAKYIREVI
jgi:predicted PurR-regulated permease PerM